MKNYLKQGFLGYYESTFKPVALKCSEGYKTMLLAENKQIDVDSSKLDFLKKTVDGMAIWNIGLLIGDIEKAKISRGGLNLVNQICGVSDCLNSDSYWTNVWKNDISSDEAKNLKKLAPIVMELMRKI